MFKFDLKSVLLMSMSSENPIHRYKRFHFGKSCYVVHFDLSGTRLIIRQVKKIKRSQSKNFYKKRIRLARMIKLRRTSTPMANDKRKDLDSAKKRTQAQTKETQNIGTDTSDLILQLPKEQQTVNKVFYSNASQTNALKMDSQASQTRICTESKATQSDVISRLTRNTGIQTDCTTNARCYQEVILEKIALTLVNQSSILKSNVVLVEHLIEVITQRSALHQMRTSIAKNRRKTESRTKHQWRPSIRSLRLRCKKRWQNPNQLTHPLRFTHTVDKAIQTETYNADVHTQTNKRRNWF